MGNPRSQKNKAHKTRFSSKSSRHVHKQATTASHGAGRSHQSHPAQNARVARLHRNKLVRDQKRSALLADKRLGGEANCAPLVLALVGLSSRANIGKAKKLLVEQINASALNPENAMDVAEESTEGCITTHLCHQHKLRVTVIEAHQEELQECLAMAKVADVIAFVTALTCEKDQFVDRTGKLCLSMLRAQGLPTVFGLMLDLEDIPVKKRLDAKKVCTSVLEAELPESSKIFSASEDCEQVLRYLSSHRLSSPQWRNNRPFMLAQKLEFVGNEQTPERGTLLFSGYIRGRSLSVNQLVHISGVGDFQLKQIDLLEDPFPYRRGKKLVKEDQMQIESSTGDNAPMLHPDPSLQELLIIENTVDTLAGEQTWPTEEELAKAKQEHIQKKKKRQLPKGTSEYQATWIVDESEEEADDGDGVEESMEGMDMQAEENKQGLLPEEKGHNKEDALSDVSSLEDDDYDKHSEMMVEEEETQEERIAELERVKAAHIADGEFPDEVDTPLDIPARQRFGKYRGLKSLRTSAWDPKELLPAEYGRIFSFENFARTQRHVFAKAKEVDEGKADGCAHLGSYVRLHIKDVPTKSALSLDIKYKQSPVAVCGLLQHESKMSVLHFSVKKHDNFTEPLRSKELLIFHVGFRVYKTRPIFSSDDINMDKHKLERFLHPGRFCVASIFAPVTFPPLPLVVLKEKGSGEGLVFVASGSLKSVDPDRIILKKIVLSGYPQRVQKQKAVVRFMFHNPEDVRWFKPLELWTKYGRRGRIKEPVGTHGSMKCIFDGVLQQRDAVCVSLYKRVYPKWPVFRS